MKKLLSFVMLSVLITGVAFAEVGTVEGTVMDSAGDLVEGARIGLQLEDVCVLTTFTSADGTYQFTEVEEGIYNLKASKKRVGNFLVENVVVVAFETTQVPEITLVFDGIGGGNGPGHHGGKVDGVIETTFSQLATKAAAADEAMGLDNIKALYR